MEPEQRKKFSWRPLVFLLVGGTNTLLDFLFYTLLTRLVFPSPEQIGLVGVVSGTIALIIAFITHKLITWRDRKATRFTIIKFFIVTGFGLWVIRPILLVILVPQKLLYEPIYKLIHSATSLPIDYDAVASTGAFLIMVVIVMIYNYVTYSRFVFNDDTDRKTRLES